LFTKRPKLHFSTEIVDISGDKECLAASKAGHFYYLANWCIFNQNKYSFIFNKIRNSITKAIKIKKFLMIVDKYNNTVNKLCCFNEKTTLTCPSHYDLIGNSAKLEHLLTIPPKGKPQG